MRAQRNWRLGLLSVAPVAVALAGIWAIPNLPFGDDPPEQPSFPRTGMALFEDSGSDLDAEALWGEVDCENATRLRLLDGGGDPSPRADGSRQDNESFRRLLVRDGDDVFGERCELGLNDHRESPTALYREGERAITFLSLRLAPRFPVRARTYQVVMQMKQSQPADAGGGPPILSLEARDGRWRLTQHSAEETRFERGQVWSGPAAKGVWTRFAFDVVYSTDPGRGAVRVSADLDGDGDLGDPAEQSPRIVLRTLKPERAGSNDDGLAHGDSIPSHLRVGLYHDERIGCRGGRCRVDVDNVGIYEPAQ